MSKFDEIEQHALAVVNGSLSMQSLLYDLDMLPEQLKRVKKGKWRTMVLMAAAFEVGQQNPMKGKP